MSLNLNSPTVQLMLQNTPYGVGSMPIYYGNSPSISTEYVYQNTTQANNQMAGIEQPFRSPYPSPRDMVNNIQPRYEYYQAPQYQQNNYGYNMAFNNYYNPYMSQQPNWNNYNNYFESMSSYQSQVNSIYNRVIQFQDVRDDIEAARMKGISYNQQVDHVSKLYKLMSRIACEAMGKSEEEIKRRQALYDVSPLWISYEEWNDRRMKYLNRSRKIKPMKVSCTLKNEETGEIITLGYIDNGIEPKEIDARIFESSVNHIERMAIESERCRQIYSARLEEACRTSIEHKYDNVGLFEYLNNGGAAEAGAFYNNIKLIESKRRRTSSIYDSDTFKSQLLKNSADRTTDELKAVQKFAGRNGVLPGGIPVSAYHDPSIAESFSYNPNTGQIDITPPNFIKERLERARLKFIDSMNL